jgi:hypothetical protein
MKTKLKNENNENNTETRRLQLNNKKTQLTFLNKNTATISVAIKQNKNHWESPLMLITQ